MGLVVLACDKSDRNKRRQINKKPILKASGMSFQSVRRRLTFPLLVLTLSLQHSGEASPTLHRGFALIAILNLRRTLCNGNHR